MIKCKSLIYIVNNFRHHNQCRGGQCLPNCVQIVLCGDVIMKLLKCNRNEKHPPLNTIDTSGAKKLKSGMGKSRSTSQPGLKFPIQRDIRFKSEKKFQTKKRNQQLQNCRLQIQQSLNPSTSIQTQSIVCFETKV